MVGLDPLNSANISEKQKVHLSEWIRSSNQVMSFTDHFLWFLSNNKTSCNNTSKREAQYRLVNYFLHLLNKPSRYNASSTRYPQSLLARFGN